MRTIAEIVKTEDLDSSQFKDVSKLLSTRRRSPLALRLGGKRRSSPITSGVLSKLTRQLGNQRNVPNPSTLQLGANCNQPPRYSEGRSRSSRRFQPCAYPL